LAFVVAAWIGVNLIVVTFGRPAFGAQAFLRLQGAVNLFSLFIVTLVLVRRSAPVSRYIFVTLDGSAVLKSARPKPVLVRLAFRTALPLPQRVRAFAEALMLR
jgi:hypothetical protein